MNWQKLTAARVQLLIAAAMIVAALLAANRWSVFLQASVLAVGLVLAWLMKRPSRTGGVLLSFYIGCVFLLALIESLTESRIPSLWLYGGLMMTYGMQIEGRKAYDCHWLDRIRTASSKRGNP